MSVKVMMLDDDDTDAMLVRRLLERSRHADAEFRHCADEELAIEQVRIFEPDLLLIDYRLVFRDGLEVYQRLQAAGHAPPAVLLTGLSDGEIVRRAERGGFLEVHSKDDVTSEFLDAAIERAVGESLPST